MCGNFAMDHDNASSHISLCTPNFTSKNTIVEFHLSYSPDLGLRQFDTDDPS